MVPENRASYPRVKIRTPAGVGSKDHRAPRDWSANQVFDHPGQVSAGVGEAVEIVLALAPRCDDAAMPEQRQVMADGRLALAQLGTQGANVAFALGEDQDDLKAGGIAHMLEQDRRPLCLLEPVVGSFRLGLADGLGHDRGLGTGLRYCHETALLS